MLNVLPRPEVFCCCVVHEDLAQVVVVALADAEESGLTTGRVLWWHKLKRPSRGSRETGGIGKFNPANCPERQVTENATSQAFQGYFRLAVIREELVGKSSTNPR